MKRYLSVIAFLTTALLFPGKGLALTKAELATMAMKAHNLPQGEQKARELNDCAYYAIRVDTGIAIQCAKAAIPLCDSFELPGIKSECLTTLGNVYRHTNQREKALTYLHAGLVIRIEQKDAKRMVSSYQAIGHVYNESDSITKALNSYYQAYRIAADQTEPWAELSKGKLAQNVADLYLKEQQFFPALVYAQYSLKVFQKLENPVNEANALLTIGTVHQVRRQFERALSYYNKSFEVAREAEFEVGMLRASQNLGGVYYKLGLSKQAKVYSQAALDFYEGREADAHKGKTLSVLGLAQLDLGEFQKAKENFLKARELSIKYEHRGLEIGLLNNLGLLEYKSEQYPAAKGYYETSLELQQQAKDSTFRQETLIGLFLVHGSMQNHDTALDYLLDFKQTVSAQQGKMASAAEAEASLLASHTDLALQAKDHELFVAQSQTQTTRWAAAVVGLILIGLILFALFLTYRSRKRMEIEKKRAEIAEANEKFNREKAELASKRAELAEKNEELNRQKVKLEVQEEERKRIAADLHDSLGAKLSATKLKFLKYQSSGQNQASLVSASSEYTQFQEALDYLDEAVQTVRKIAHDMNYGVLKDFGLIVALEDHLDSLQETSELDIEYVIWGFENKKRLAAEVEQQLFHIITEALNNILKHAKAQTASVQVIRNEDNLQIQIEDDGIGFNHQNATFKSGMGLTTMQSRVDKLKGTLNIDSQINNGSMIIIEIPLTFT